MKSTLVAGALSILVLSSAQAAVVPTDGAQMLIPVAGYTAGANGEFFTTDLSLVNLTRVTQRIRLTWLPLGGTDAPVTRSVTVDGFAVQPLVHVVRQVFATEGVGAILIDAFDPTTPVPAAIDAHARIWTESICSGVPGTVSQSVPALRLDGWRNTSPAYIHGVRQNPGFRTNYGIVNLHSQPLDFEVIVNSAAGRFTEQVTVPANGTIHRRVPGSPDGELSIYIEPVLAPSLPPENAFGPWRAYAATTDNASGSGWTVEAIQPRNDIQF
jgi:hypothetical protein